jgi:hypothetical protein
MGGGRARIGPRPFILLEQADGEPAATEQPGTEKSHRAAARDQHAPAVNAHANNLDSK